MKTVGWVCYLKDSKGIDFALCSCILAIQAFKYNTFFGALVTRFFPLTLFPLVLSNIHTRSLIEELFEYIYQ